MCKSCEGGFLNDAQAAYTISASTHCAAGEFLNDVQVCAQWIKHFYKPLSIICTMEGCNTALLAPLVDASSAAVRKVLSSEGSSYEVTKSLVNLLYNITIVGSIPSDSDTRQFLDRKAELVLDLVSPTKPLWWKQKQFLHNPALVRTIAKTCPRDV